MTTSMIFRPLVSSLLTLALCGCGSEERSGRGDAGASKVTVADGAKGADTRVVVQQHHEETVDAQVSPLKLDAFVVPKESGSTMFGDLFAETGADDPCLDAFPWQPKLVIHMEPGDYVTYEGKLYQYVGTKAQDWSREDCAPGAATGFDCSADKWWKETETSCP